MHNWNYDGHMSWMSWTPIWWILGPVLIAVVVGALLRSRRGSGSTNNVSESPEETLKRRYARGEVDRETYQRMLTDLKR